MYGRTLSIGLVVIGLMLGGCAHVHKLTVQTDPPGAQVSLVKIGVRHAEGQIQSLQGYGSFQSTFQDPPIFLGTAPVAYDFSPNETEAQINLPGIWAHVYKETREALIIATQGDLQAEQRVRFGDQPVELFLQLTPAPPSPAEPPPPPVPDPPRPEPPQGGSPPDEPPSDAPPTGEPDRT